MFEPQDHPRDEAYPGGPPVPPYDIAGWTLAMQMGVEYDRILEDFTGPFTKLDFRMLSPAGSIVGASNPAGYLISHHINNSFALVNRLLKNKSDVYWLKTALTADGQDLGTGTIWVPASSTVRGVLEKGAKDLGIIVHAVAKAPSGEAFKIQPVRIGLYDQYGGMMPSGWTRWLFEQFEFPFEIVYPTTLDAGNLRAKFDVLVFADGAMRRGNTGRGAGGGGRGGAVDPESVPEEYRASIGRITEEKTMPEIKKFVESGGAIVTVGSSTTMAELLGVPISNHLANLPRDKFYIPGSLIRTTIDNTDPLAYGMPKTVETFFDNSPVFDVGAGVKSVASFVGKDTLDSGWAWGQEHLDGGVAVAEAKVGEGKVMMMGPEVTFRGEPHATFKLMFNSILYGNAQTTQLK
jgi:hypothetical protein